MEQTESSDRDVVVYRGALLYEADMVALALQEAAIPHYRRLENFAGLQFAMPALAAPGPGTFFLIIVPAAAAEDALQVVRSLPLDLEENPSIWSFRPNSKARRIWLAYIRISLIGFAVYVVARLWELFHELVRP